MRQRQKISIGSYCFAIIIFFAAMAWMVKIHWPFWMAGNYFLSAFSLSGMLLPLFACMVFWCIGCFAQQRPTLDLALLFLFALMGIIFWIMPSRFSMA